MVIRELRESDREALHAFFLSLSDETVSNQHRWNGRQGPANKDPQARAAADAQTSPMVVNEGDEVGWVAVDEFVGYTGTGEGRGFMGNWAKVETITGYGFLRFVPYKETQKFTCNLGIVVADRFQKHGIGKALMQRMVDEAKKRGMRKVWLQTYSDNFAAIGLYRKFGFSVEGIFKNQEWRESGDGQDVPVDVVSMGLLL